MFCLFISLSFSLLLSFSPYSVSLFIFLSLCFFPFLYVLSLYLFFFLSASFLFSLFCLQVCLSSSYSLYNLQVCISRLASHNTLISIKIQFNLSSEIIYPAENFFFCSNVFQDLKYTIGTGG